MTILFMNVKHACSDATTPLILCVTPSGPEDSPPQFWHSGSGVIHISDPYPHLVQTCLKMFMSVHKAGQSMTCMTSTSCCSRKAAVSRAVWEIALSWTYTKFSPKTHIAQGSMLSQSSLMRRWRLVVPSRKNSSLPHHGGWYPTSWMGGNGYHPWVWCMHQSLPLSNSVKRDSSLKTQCLRSHFLCVSTTHGSVTCGQK